MTSRGRSRRPPPPPPGSGKPSPPPPPECPVYGHPRGAGGGTIDSWVQQHQQQRATWEVRAISAEAASRDLGARLSRANEDRWAAETQLAPVTRDTDRLASRVEIPECDWRRRATPRGAGHQDRQGRGAQRPRGRGGGALPPSFVTFWPARRHGMPRLRQQQDRCLTRP